MAKLTAKGQEKLALLERAEQSGKITARGSQVLGALRQASEAPLKPFKQPEQPGVAAKTWNAMGAPERMSRQGLQMMARMTAPKTEVTGNMMRDLGMNAPKIVLETLGETAPSFVSPESIATGGLLRGANAASGLRAVKTARGLLSSARKGAFSMMEKTSGLAPKNEGLLNQAYKDPSLFFASGKQAASPIYEAGKKITGPVREGLAETPQKLKFIKRVSKLADKGKANPLEALEARKELDDIENAVTGTFFRTTRKKLDDIAKTVFEKADSVHGRGVKGKALRNLFPTNVGGTFSSWRTTGAAGLTMLPGGKVMAPIAFSPAVQGAAATAMGAIAKGAGKVTDKVLEIAPQTGARLAAVAVLTEDKAREYLRKAKGNPEKARAAAIKDGYPIPE